MLLKSALLFLGLCTLAPIILGLFSDDPYKVWSELLNVSSLSGVLNYFAFGLFLTFLPFLWILNDLAEALKKRNYVERRSESQTEEFSNS